MNTSTIPEPQKLTEQHYSNELVDMTPEKDKALSEALYEVLEDFLDNYEPINFDGLDFERVEHQARDGFIPFTEGGFNTLVIYPLSADSAHMPPRFDDFYEDVIEQCRMDFYHDQTDEWGSKEEIDEYFGELFHPETGLAEDQEVYYVWENEYLIEGDMPSVSIMVLYLSADNPRNEEMRGQDCVVTLVTENRDAPYYRDGRGISIGEPKYYPMNMDNLDEYVAAGLREQLEAV